VTDIGKDVNQALHQAKEFATQLAHILELEFQALRDQALDQFEQLQLVKNQLLSEISALAPGAEELQTLPEWQDFREMMVICRDFHRRNALLMNRKLDAIRGTLDSLRLNDTASPVEVYDRLGLISRFSRHTAYSDA
jgi:flagellar biosynthesis/type III secretory pathway chaperone